MTTTPKQKYPEDAIESLDKYFPKGHKDRGKVMMILSIAFAEGKKIGAKHEQN